MGVSPWVSTPNREEPPPPPPGSGPSPDIKANNQHDPVAVVHGRPVSVAVSLDAGNWKDRQADWWVTADTPFGWYSYTYPDGWRPGVRLCTQTGLFDLTPSFEVLNMILPVGEYRFYFAVDGDADSEVDATWMDSVKVTME